MGRMTDVPLILGGHSFISQLGNDPPASEQEQRRITEACLDHGIVWFDSTYKPERIALGKALHALGRRNEATILAWNFFTDFSPGDPVGGPEYYRPGHIDSILEQLHSVYVDILVVVPLENLEQNNRQQELVIEWQKKGYVRSLGLWISDPAVLEHHGKENPYRYAIRPNNITTQGAAPVFAACKARGWETIATSPFFRGWELDRVIAEAAARKHGDPETLRPMVADLMLRYSLFQVDVDRVIVAMRKVQWITRNLESISRGPLTVEEHRLLLQLDGLGRRKRRWLQRLRALSSRKHRLWQRLRYRS
jgi:aryl-alcohol dehydrogenase-like predicted oxidoreductase